MVSSKVLKKCQVRVWGVLPNITSYERPKVTTGEMFVAKRGGVQCQKQAWRSPAPDVNMVLCNYIGRTEDFSLNLDERISFIHMDQMTFLAFECV